MKEILEKVLEALHILALNCEYPSDRDDILRLLGQAEDVIKRTDKKGFP